MTYTDAEYDTLSQGRGNLLPAKRVTNKENTMSTNNFAELKKAIETLEGLDLEQVKKALSLVGEGLPNYEEPVVERFDIGSKIKIAILQRGWVAVGHFSQEGSKFTLSDASTIRYWGTTKGIGELVNGPTDKTKLDKAGTVIFERLTTVALVDVDDKAWESKL